MRLWLILFVAVFAKEGGDSGSPRDMVGLTKKQLRGMVIKALELVPSEVSIPVHTKEGTSTYTIHVDEIPKEAQVKLMDTTMAMAQELLAGGILPKFTPEQMENVAMEFLQTGQLPEGMLEMLDREGMSAFFDMDDNVAEEVHARLADVAQTVVESGVPLITEEGVAV